MSRKSGILLPIFSLPSPYGIGTLGDQAYNWIDFMHQAHQCVWQVLPVGPTGYGDSPYQSFSSFAGNPYFVDLNILCAQGLLKREECDAVKWCTNENQVNYLLLYQSRYKLLRKAYARYTDKETIEIFSKKYPWVNEYALFMAIKDKLGGVSWLNWPNDLRTRDVHVIEKIHTELSEDINFYIFIQVLFYTQWKALKKYANEKGVAILGDMPIYTAFDSADVWSNQELFYLHRDGSPIEVAGCPPDAFSKDGQLWGNPLYRWEIMKEDGYVWWLSRLSTALCLFDMIRMDHFRGFESYYAIPGGDKTARNGHWCRGPGRDFISKVKEAFPKADIIAEDLGFLTSDVKELLNYSGYPGMKILQFAFDTRETNDYAPHTYQKNCVVYTGTHDNDTTLGWLNNAAIADVSFAKEYLRCTDKDSLSCVREFIYTAFESVADLVIIPAQDWLGLDSSARINTPSKLGGNWQWRLGVHALTDELADEIARISFVYSRNC